MSGRRHITTEIERIKEGLARQIFIWHIGKPKMWDEKWDKPDHFLSWEGPPREDYFEAANMVMKEMRSQGVMLTEERELPPLPSELAGWPIHTRYYKQSQQDMLKAGYRYCVPLGEEE